MRRKSCRCCRELYQPHPQTYLQQTTCDKESCRAWRKRRAQKIWSQKNPLYWNGDRKELKDWRQNHPDYYRQWRAQHPQYVARNRKAQKARDAKKRGFLAKQDAWRPIWLQNLDKLRRIRNLQVLAKQDEWQEQLRRYLRDQVLLAKQDDIAQSGAFMRK